MGFSLPTAVTPSYAQGFARSADESANPGLWRGLVGAWMPTLGVTGNQLMDVVRSANGTGSGMDPATDWVASQFGPALEFDGGTQRIGDITLGNVLDGEFISCWGLFKADDFGSTFSRIIDRTFNGQFACYVSSSAGNLGMSVVGSGGSFDSFGWNTAGLVAGRWYSVVWVYDGATAQGYVDGLDVGSGLFTVGALDAFSGETRIGNRADGTNRGWDGKIAAVALWNRPLTPVESRQLYVDPHALARGRTTILARDQAAAPTGAIMNQLQQSNLGADLYNGTIQ